MLWEPFFIGNALDALFQLSKILFVCNYVAHVSKMAILYEWILTTCFFKDYLYFIDIVSQGIGREKYFSFYYIRTIALWELFWLEEQNC